MNYDVEKCTYVDDYGGPCVSWEVLIPGPCDIDAWNALVDHCEGLFGPHGKSLEDDGKLRSGWRWEKIWSVGVRIEQKDDVALVLLVTE